jgi:hypothetical protein
MYRNRRCGGAGADQGEPSLDAGADGASWRREALDAP